MKTWIVLAVLVVAAVVSAEPRLSWEAVTTYEDGTPLPTEELLGYQVYMGESPTSLTAVNPGVGPTVRERLLNTIPGAAKNKYFAVTAIGTGGESALSNVLKYKPPSAPKKLSSRP